MELFIISAVFICLENGTFIFLFIKSNLGFRTKLNDNVPRMFWMQYQFAYDFNDNSKIIQEYSVSASE